MKADAAAFEDFDLETEGGCETAEPEAGDEPSKATQPIAPAEQIEAEASPAKVKKAARSKGRG
ncbi:hypothetical protein [Oceanicaulis alexandrii]|uniref:hypothetical protein n=1 Tax=Oceanicaulis alexandrii TaxID=153233 RepID=UPI0023553C54|nr:hypothetical protein [Oceanicaulis alexandrii]